MTSIILLLADDLGRSDMSFYGGNAQTQNLNAMANSKHSIVFDRFYANSPVCSPTRASLLTGKNANRFRIWNANGKYGNSAQDFVQPSVHPLPTNAKTLPKLL